MTENPSLFSDLNPIRKGIQLLINQGAEAINWHDEDGVFVEDVLHLNIDGLDVIRETDYLKLQLKRMLMGVPERPFLLYTTGQIPPEKDDMLLDVRRYAAPFRADAASLRRAELGLAERIDLNNWVTDRKKFLASAARVNKFKPLIEPHDSQNDLDRKALAVLAKSASTEPRDILLSMLDGLNDLDDEPQCWREVESFDLDSAFWDLYGARFGIPVDARNFRAFILRLFATDFVSSCPGAKLGSSVTSMKLDAGNEVAVFMSQWRDSHTKAKSFRRLSKATASVLKVSEAMHGAGSTALLSAETFEAIDHKILVKIRNALLKPITDAMKTEFLNTIQSRQATHWVMGEHGKSLDACYEALLEAMNLFERVSKFNNDLVNTPPEALPEAYATSWFLIDMAYRRFMVNFDIAVESGIDLLKDLAGTVEDSYCNGFLSKLGSRWAEALDDQFLTSWNVPGFPLQRNFFSQQVKAHLDDGIKRIYVIISDALRFEAAADLTDRLRRFRLEPTLSPMVGVLPSVTAIGMAALLPHDQMSITDKGQVLVDGQSTSGLDARQKILNAVNGIAIGAEEFKSLKRETGRNMVKDAEVVYIYHDVIDATGDKTSSEGETFVATERAIEELAQMVRRVIDHFNGSTVLVTADHGFLFTQSSPKEIDKSSLGGKVEDAVIAKKRYIVGGQVPKGKSWHSAPLKETSGIESELDAIYPRSTQRFHLAGGAQYVHGGPMPQEVIVPLVLIKEITGKSAEKSHARCVNIALANSISRVTTNQQNWKFLQTEAVGGRLKPLSATVGIYDGDRLVSNAPPILFESSSELMSDRERKVTLILAAETFDRSKHYDLIVRNSEDGTEVFRHSLTLDIAFTNEF